MCIYTQVYSTNDKAETHKSRNLHTIVMSEKQLYQTVL